jgi:hypothetical protein
MEKFDFSQMALRSRLAELVPFFLREGGFKPPNGAVVKSYGAERFG